MVAIKQPRKFTFFFTPSVADPGWQIPVAEIFPDHSWLYYGGWKARLLTRLVNLLLESPQRGWELHRPEGQ